MSPSRSKPTSKTMEAIKSFFSPAGVAMFFLAAATVFHSMGFAVTVPSDANAQLQAKADSNARRITALEIKTHSIEQYVHLLAYFTCSDHAKRGDVVLPPICSEVIRIHTEGGSR